MTIRSSQQTDDLGVYMYVIHLAVSSLLRGQRVRTHREPVAFNDKCILSRYDVI